MATFNMTLLVVIPDNILRETNQKGDDEEFMLHTVEGSFHKSLLQVTVMDCKEIPL